MGGTRGSVGKNSWGGGVSGLHLPSKEFELNVFKPKLFLNHFSSYVRRTTSDFGGHGSK